jgi:hypothetical protein
MHDDPLMKFIAPLAGVVLAVVLSVLVAATVAGNLDGDYETRAWIYSGCVLWVIAGAIAVFAVTHRGETRPLSPLRVLLWTASIWLWPLILLRVSRREDSGGAPPPAA